MKPVTLTLAGLQSYREAQRIDFSALCEAGVFGIFGPTGSGKSTILDAITLAMYGSVERAGNSIQGIMNAMEDALSVSFEFELAEGTRRRTYRVERTYRRKTDGSVEQRLSRLTEVGVEAGSEDVVLADKSGEVTSMVEKLIGLSMTDFTRAVVLPQGKFSEFLGLKGRERREMLQRLFRLERYGDELAGRLAGRVRGVESRMRETAAELQGLGDASPQAVAAAEKELADASLSEQASLERLRAIEAKHAETARLWEWQGEARALEAERTSLSSREEEAAAMEAALADAAAADRLVPMADERREASNRAQRLEAECRRLEAAFKEAADRYAALREEHRAAELRLAEGEAPALVRLEQLRQAIELSEQVRAGEQSALSWAAAREKALMERDACAEALEKKTTLRTKALTKQNELRKEFVGCDVSADERRSVASAESARSAWAAAVKAAQAARAEADAYAKTVAGREAEVLRLEEQADGYLRRLLPLQDSLGRYAAELRETDTIVAGWERTLPEAIDSARADIAAGERKALALTLAQSLVPGESCPVCGSTHHPGIESSAGDEEHKRGQENRERLQSLEKLLTGVRSLSALVSREAAAAGNGLDRLFAALGVQNDTERESSAVDEAAAALDVADAGALSEAFEQRRTAVAEASEHIRGIAAEIGPALQQWEACRSRLRDASAALAAERGVKDTAVFKANALESDAASLGAAWAREFPGLTPETLEERMRDIERRDETARELRERLDKSEQFLAGIAAELEALQRELAEKDKALISAQAQEEAESRALALKRESLHRAAGDGGDPSEQARQLQASLERLREQERGLRAAAEESRLSSEDASRALAAGAEALKGARERLQETEDRWRKSLEASPFESEEEVLSKRLPEERRQALAESAARYRESVASVTARLEAVLARLGGRTVEEGEWKEAADSLESAKREREAALEARAAAERSAVQLREKHEQWMRLTKEHEQLADLHGKLSKLQAVFRGNAFVEFLAEKQLYGVTQAASERLAQLTRGRYAIEVDSNGGFVIRDDANGGIRRPVSTLSGGETFLTSLSLALALSAQIQLGGKYPLEFFFLDEGFGTLDPELLDNVVTALERLHVERFSVGVISHVPELQARLPRKLVVRAADPLGAGSRVRMETI
ncbi:AAA family ATPase [Paenibacillus alkalitolerans]|uniref:AAA family ATPase n=1 Tax=Paenibacillus alkalitolerans TaxID=2799335 RepID=UPI0018F65A02|nr:AAA family ATPase [Paenibacillus alkalitolerans]